MGYQQWSLRLTLLFLVGGAFAPVARAQLPLNSTSTLYAYCVDQYGYIVYYCNVTISNGYSNFSGGHQHEDFAKPYSTVSPTYGNTGYWGLPLAVTTDEVGGVEYIDVCATFCGRSYFAVGVGGLYTLPFGQQTYVNIGWTSIHPWGNHYGTLNTVYGVQDTASQYHAEYPQHPIIAINDLSLVYGGLFDVASPNGAHLTTRIATERPLISVGMGRRTRFPAFLTYKPDLNRFASRMERFGLFTKKRIRPKSTFTASGDPRNDEKQYDTSVDDLGVLSSGRHSCCSARGVCRP